MISIGEGGGGNVSTCGGLGQAKKAFPDSSMSIGRSTGSPLTVISTFGGEGEGERQRDRKGEREGGGRERGGEREGRGKGKGEK